MFAHPSEFDPGASVVLIDREPQRDVLLRLLETDQPVLALITGEAGVGKSTLLRFVVESGRKAGWTVIGPLVITMDTEVDDVAGVFRRAAGTSADLPGSTVEARPEDLLHSPTSQSASVTSSLAATVTRLRPLVIAVDGYAPTPELEAWFLRRFIPALFDLGGQVVVVVAQRLDLSDAIAAVARVHIDVPPLDRAAIAAFLGVLGASLSPPAGREEISLLVDAAAADPDVIGSLVRALAFDLSLARQDLEHG